MAKELDRSPVIGSASRAFVSNQIEWSVDSSGVELKGSPWHENLGLDVVSSTLDKTTLFPSTLFNVSYAELNKNINLVVQRIYNVKRF